MLLRRERQMTLLRLSFWLIVSPGTGLLQNRDLSTSNPSTQGTSECSVQIYGH